jgi:hypothetical protein
MKINFTHQEVDILQDLLHKEIKEIESGPDGVYTSTEVYKDLIYKLESIYAKI